MKVWGMVLGGYPRSRLARYTLRDLERGDLSLSDYTQRIRATHAEIIGVQKGAGLPVVVDGMVDWHDMFRPFVRSWRNVSLDGLLRYFDNNFFYRIPVFTGEPDIIEPVWAWRVREFSLLADPARLKIVLPGPLTMAKMSKNNTSLSIEDLADRIARLLRREVELVSGFDVFVQIDEPILSDRKTTVDDAKLAVDLANEIVKDVEDRSVFAVYFDFPSKSIVEELLNLNAKYLMLDISDSIIRAEREAVPLTGHVPVLGIIDGRRIHEDQISERIIRIIKTLAQDTEEIVVSTTTWMDLIPYRYALKKTFILARTVESLASKLKGEPVRLWR